MRFEWNKQFVVDLFNTIPTIILGTSGATIGILGLIAFDSMTFTLVGISLCGAGVAYAAQRLITDGKKISDKVIERERLQQVEKEEIRLFECANKIKNYPSKKIRECFHDMRTLKKAFNENILQEDISAFITPSFQDSFTNMFWKSIAMIEQAARLHEISRTMTNKGKIEIARDKLVAEVEQNLVSLTTSFEGLTTLALTQDVGGLDDLRSELEIKLEVANAIEEELGEFHLHTEKYIH